MRWPIVFVLSAVLVITCAEQYTSKYDGTNIQEILAHKKILCNYIKCITDKGPCTAEGRELKAHIKDALHTKCQKCTEKQREGAKLVIKHLRDKEPEHWKEVKAKYDPNNEYEANYASFLDD